MRLRVDIESWPYKTPFRVSRGAEDALGVVVVTLEDNDGHIGRGEAAGVDYDGETVGSMAAQIEAIRDVVEQGLDFQELGRLLPAGGARNAIDCALWDVTAKCRGVTVWDLAGFPNPRQLRTSITFGIDSDDVIAASAREYFDWPSIKVKVDGQRHVDVVRKVHEICPAAALIVDPNQAWSCALLNRLSPELHDCGVVLIEQPLPREEDEALRGYTGPIPLAADESVADRFALPRIKDLYQVANIKLDKSGGLTEGLATARAARALGMRVMVGCMAGTSLSMAPGMVVGQLADFVDLDGPLLHTRDRAHGIEYDHGSMQLPLPALWG
jgi:L-Ala-D/L-Glu epimerase